MSISNDRSKTTRPKPPRHHRSIEAFRRRTLAALRRARNVAEKATTERAAGWDTGMDEAIVIVETVQP